MSNLEDYAKSERAFKNAKRLKSQHPNGWEPGLDTTKKEINYCETGNCACLKCHPLDDILN